MLKCADCCMTSNHPNDEAIQEYFRNLKQLLIFYIYIYIYYDSQRTHV